MTSVKTQLPITSCMKNISYEESARLLNILKPFLYPVYRFYFGLLPLPLAITAMGLTIAYAAAVMCAMKQRRVSRKCYILLLNRAIGDIMCCCCCLLTSLYLIVVTVENFDVQILRVLATFAGSSYWSVMISYVSLSVLKLLAIYQPLQYKKMVTIDRCIHLVVLSWLIYILMVMYTLAAITFVTVPTLQKWSGCRSDTCTCVMTQIRQSLFAALYALTLIAFACTVILVKRRTEQSKCLRQKYDHMRRIEKRFPFWKLTLNVSTFAIFNLIYVVKVFYLKVYDICSVSAHNPGVVILFGLVWYTLILRILADAIFGFAIDRQVRISLSHLVGGSSTSKTTNVRG